MQPAPQSVRIGGIGVSHGVGTNFRELYPKGGDVTIPMDPRRANNCSGWLHERLDMGGIAKVGHGTRYYARKGYDDKLDNSKLPIQT